MEDLSRNTRNRALCLLEQVPLIDGHNDFAYMLRGWYQNNLNQPGFNIHSMPIGQTDIQRLQKGRLGGQFWSAFVPSAKDGESQHSLILSTIQQIDLLHSIFERYSSNFAFASHSSEIIPAFRTGRVVSLLGIEGLHQIGGSPSVLRMLFRLGVRYATLCHNKGNEFVDSATAAEIHGGLSDFGKKLVLEMNRIGILSDVFKLHIRGIGINTLPAHADSVNDSYQRRRERSEALMIVDLSHTSHGAQLQVLAQSEAPIIFSHASCYELCPNPRNVRDDVLQRLKANRGLIMICFIPSLITPMQTEHNVSSGGRDSGPSIISIADHIIYVGNLIGYSHVGIGSDFDGMLEGPPGLDDTSGFPALIEELVRRNVTDENIKLIMGLNVIRVMEEVETVSRAARYVEKWEILCDEIATPWTKEQVSLLVERGSLRTKNGL